MTRNKNKRIYLLRWFVSFITRPLSDKNYITRIFIMKNRSETLDFFRGLGILLVVLGHASFIPEELFDLIYSFHMPAFFILSGYLFKLKKDKSCFEQIYIRFQRLVIPAWTLGVFFTGIPFFILLILGKSGITIDVFINKFYGTLTGATSSSNNFSSTPIWFLYSLFTIEVIVISLGFYKKVRSDILLFFISFLSVIFSGLSLFKGFPFNPMSSLSCMLFFVIGMNLHKIKHEYKTWYLSTFVFVTFSIITYYSDSTVKVLINSWGNGYYDIMINLINALLGSLCLYYISCFFVTLKIKSLTRFVTWLGVNTIPIIMFNYFANNIARKITTFIGLGESWFSVFVFGVLILCCVIYVISNIKILDDLSKGKLSNLVSIR